MANQQNPNEKSKNPNVNQPMNDPQQRQAPKRPESESSFMEEDNKRKQ